MRATARDQRYQLPQTIATIGQALERNFQGYSLGIWPPSNTRYRLDDHPTRPELFQDACWLRRIGKFLVLKANPMAQVKSENCCKFASARLMTA